jgi:hypothetical protein
VLSRLEDEKTGQDAAKDFHVDIPAQRLAQAKVAAKVLGDEGWNKFPWHDGVKPMHTDTAS